MCDASRARTLAANGMRDGVHIRLTLTRGVKYTSGMDPRLNQSGPTLIVLAEHKPPVYDRSAGITLITSSVRRFPPDCLDPKIHHNNLINSILAKIQANTAGADDALMLDARGFVAETNATHVFMVTDGVVATPTAIWGTIASRHSPSSGKPFTDGMMTEIIGAELLPRCGFMPALPGFERRRLRAAAAA